MGGGEYRRPPFDRLLFRGFVLLFDFNILYWKGCIHITHETEGGFRLFKSVGSLSFFYIFLFELLSIPGAVY